MKHKFKFHIGWHYMKSGSWNWKKPWKKEGVPSPQEASLKKGKSLYIWSSSIHFQGQSVISFRDRTLKQTLVSCHQWINEGCGTKVTVQGYRRKSQWKSRWLQVALKTFGADFSMILTQDSGPFFKEMLGYLLDDHHSNLFDPKNVPFHFDQPILLRNICVPFCWLSHFTHLFCRIPNKNAMSFSQPNP